MPDFRVHSIPPETAPTTLQLTPDESHHLIVVNRARRGAPVIAFDGRGTEWICELTTDAKNAAVLTVRDTHRAPPLSHAITLAQALPKGPGFDDIIRKATEIGAARVVPIVSERTQVHLDGDRQDKKIEKWRTAALEAAKQCGNPWLPEIAPLQSLNAFFASHYGARSTSNSGYDLKLIASLHPGAKPLKTLFAETAAALGHAPRRVLWLIGPEGDFTPAEVETALRSGFAPATLGTLVLRCETAATYALSVTAHELSL
ncbi:16S rRNA methyltransferase [Nibricoccus aquaticus]|uniref:Ribosomal RNA small subunit methyltransferase E n=1 Tax=Nibricoccus aquaticus TaxID=2576891 RepID=A0A290QAN3_9BACT|nr:RsmE family RNA methyltransferase [Nibricoccus aquaticus]ATC63296.1 16S rRNA methyltransferase [Nibricoccus aquaticus]